MKNFLTIKNNNGSTAIINKEHITTVPYNQHEMYIYTTSGKAEFIKKSHCLNFDEVLEEIKKINLLNLEKDNETILIAENKISTIIISKNYISFYTSVNGLPITFMEDEKYFERAKEIAENLSFITIDKGEMLMKFSPESIEKIYQEMDRVVITTISGNTCRELAEKIKWND